MASSDKALIAKMKKSVSIWNINSFAEFFMQIFTKYEKDYKRACAKFLQIRKEFWDGLQSVPYLHVMPTQANFFFCEVLPPYNSNDIVISMLKKHNILMSSCSAKKAIEPNRYMRIAVRTAEENQRLVNALKTL
jgi:histidinol-phosphate/aromatic aminotransferase/cobyric acid decarboxylase-like protein